MVSAQDFVFGLARHVCGIHTDELRLLKKGPETGEVRDQLYL
jgi:hypothetical protein